MKFTWKEFTIVLWILMFINYTLICINKYLKERNTTTYYYKCTLCDKEHYITDYGCYDGRQLPKCLPDFNYTRKIEK